MGSRFTDYVAVIVTIDAAVRRLCVVKWHDKHQPARTGGVAGVACLGALRMRRRLPGRVHTRVARDTGVGRLIVIKRRDQGQPGIGGVTRVTHLAGLRMVGVFGAARAGAVVTATAVTALPCHGAVIKCASRD